jgi:hypothetical protein
MSGYLIKAGIFLLAANVFYLLIDTFWFEEKSLFSEYIDEIFYVSLAFIAGGFILRILTGLKGLFIAKKCPRCGKPVEKGEIYCPTHLKQVFDEQIDHMHGLKR